MIYYLILITMTMIGAAAGFYLKRASGSVGLKALLCNKYLYLGGILYFITAIMNIFVLRVLDYSVVLPLTSVTYIWTMIISYYILHEKISNIKIIGISMILVGALIVAI